MHVIKILFYDVSSSMLRDLNMLIPSFKLGELLYMRQEWPELKVICFYSRVVKMHITTPEFRDMCDYMLLLTGLDALLFLL